MLLQRTRSIIDISQKIFAISGQSDRVGLCSKIVSSKNVLNELTFIDWELDGRIAVAFLFTKKKVFEHADKTFDTVFRKPLIISYPSKEPLTEKVSMSFPAKFHFF